MGIKVQQVSHSQAARLAKLHKSCFQQSWGIAEFSRLLENQVVTGLMYLEDDRDIGLALLQSIAFETEILTFGIIPAFTRTICNDCNRIRITSTGMFKNCLFDGGVFNVRDFIRNGASDDDLKELFISTVHQKPENGFVAEAARGSDVSESMSTIGG